MKLAALIDFLKNLPQDCDVSVCGVDRFFMYFGRDKKKPFLTFDCDEIDADDFKSNKIKGLRIFDSIQVSTQYDIFHGRTGAIEDDLDDQIKMHKTILKTLDNTKDGK